MNTHFKFLALGLLVLFAGCATTLEVPKDVNYDYNIDIDFSKLKTYDINPTPTTVGIEHLMLVRIQTAIHNELQAKNVQRAPGNPDFLVTIYGVRTKILTAALRGPGADLIFEKAKLILQFVDPETNQVFWWGETRAILDPDTTPTDKTKMVNDVVHRILEKFPPASSLNLSQK
ncbi:MAG: DUF4136 domain-containing protein [Deltaproteobacteria bacterium]|jgi:hypothetical protein